MYRILEKAQQMADAGIKTGRIHFWRLEGEPVAMASAMRQPPGGAIINLVYTPEEFRKKGYATALVHNLTKIMLDSGKRFCGLFTDLANPVSNSIYMKIGYNPVADILHNKFR